MIVFTKDNVVKMDAILEDTPLFVEALHLCLDMSKDLCEHFPCVLSDPSGSSRSVIGYAAKPVQ